MKFLGPSVMLTNSLFTEERLSEVMVLQQHCRGSTLCIFRELLPPNSKCYFVSLKLFSVLYYYGIFDQLPLLHS